VAGRARDTGQHVFSKRSRVQALLDFADDDEWEIRPNFHVSYFRAPVRARWYTSADERPLAEYLTNWLEDCEDAAGHYPRADIEDSPFWESLLERGYAMPADRPGLDQLLETNVCAFDVRPSIEVACRWSWADAVRLDTGGQLVEAVALTLDRVLRAFDEPALESLRSETE